MFPTAPSSGAPPSSTVTATPITTTSPSTTVEGHYARVEGDQESGSDYWTCSECTCTSSGTYYTCPECRSLQDLFIYDDTRPPSEEELPLDEILRRRSRSRSKSKGRDGKSRRSRSRSRSSSKGPDEKERRSKPKTSTLPKRLKDAPQDHPDAIERARSRSRSRSKSLTREIVASFKDFRDKVTRGRSRSKSGDREIEEEPQTEPHLKEPKKEKKHKKYEEKEKEPIRPSPPRQPSTEKEKEGHSLNLGNGDVRIPIHIHVDARDGSIATPEQQQKEKWKEVSSEKVTTRLVFHGTEGQSDRTLTLEQVTSLRTPESSRSSDVIKDSIRPNEADISAMQEPVVPPPPDITQSEEKETLLPLPDEPALVSSSPSDHPCTSTTPDKSGTSPEKTQEESDVEVTNIIPTTHMPPAPPSPPQESIADQAEVPDHEESIEEPTSPRPVGLPPRAPQHPKPDEDELIRKMKKPWSGAFGNDCQVSESEEVGEGENYQGHRRPSNNSVMSSDTAGGGSVTSPTPGMSDSDGGVVGRATSASGTSRTSMTSSAPTTTISTIAVQSGNTRIIIALLQSAEWLELRVVELTPGMVYLGSTLEEAIQLQKAHDEVLTKLQSKQSPVEDLLNQADQLISTQRPRAEVYAAMAESLGLAWKDLNSQLETRKEILDMGVAFHSRARQYSDSMDAAERVYTDNVMPNDAEGARQLLSALHDHKRSILEASMYTLQEAQALLARLRGLASEGASLDSRPLHIKTNIEFSCSQIEHYLESLHDRRRFLDGLFTARKRHLEECLALCLLYQDLTEAVTALKQLRDEVSDQQGLGESQGNVEILLHEHLKRQTLAKEIQDKCVMLLKQAEKMASKGHYAGLEARSRAYSVLEAATALHETCDTRAALLQQSILFFKLAQAALTKLDQAEVQVASMGGEGAQRLSLVVGVVEEAIQPALTEGYAILEVTGGRNQPHNMGISLMVEELERRRSHLSSVCVTSTEQVLQRTELSNAFLERYNTIESWLVRIGDAFLQGHQDPGGSLSLARDFLHLHQTLNHDVMEKKGEIDALAAFLDTLVPDLPPEDADGFREKMQALIDHWTALKKLLDIRLAIAEKYVKFHENAEVVNNEHEAFEIMLKDAHGEDRHDEVEATWEKLQKLYLDLCNSGKTFCQDVKNAEDPYLDSNRAVLCVENILEQLGKRRLVVTDLHSHFHMKITTTKEMITLWNTYRDNISKMQYEMTKLETDFCPLLRGDPIDPESIAQTLEERLNGYVQAVKKTQEDIQNMMTRAEVMSYKGDQGGARDEVIGSLLQLYQNLQNKATEYQILGFMLIQWCKNIAEIHRSCDKLESQFGAVSLDIGGVEGQIREHEASKQAVLELLKFAQNEAATITTKINEQCPPAAGAQDIALIEEMLQRRGQIFEVIWTEHQSLLEKQLKRSQYHVDLQVISDQLRDLSEQLTRMRGHYGDSLAAALNMQAAFRQFKLTVDMLEKRIQTFVSTTTRMLGPEDDSGEVQQDLAELEKKWSTFQMQVGESEKSIELSIDFYTIVEEAEDWFKQGSQLLVTVAGDSANIQNPDEAEQLRTRIEIFLQPGQETQEGRINKISSLAIQLYGDNAPKQIEVVTHQHTHMIESFTVINRNLITMIENLRTAENNKEQQLKEKEELESSLAAAQADAEVAKLAALAAEEAQKAAEEVAKAMSIPVEPIVPKKVEIEIQTEAIPLPEEEPPKQEEVPPPKKVKLIDDEPQPMAPVFLTPLVGATVTEGVKFSFECRVIGFPMPQVEWLKDNMSITANPDYKTTFEEGICTLTIEETFTEDSALFTCKALNAAGMAETSATLTVKEAEVVEVMAPPTFTKKLVDCSAQEGSSYQLEATVQGHPLPVVSWAKGGACVDESPDYVITYNNGDCVLRFEEVFLEDQAEYSCKATNDLGEDLTKAKLTVTAVELSERPKFTMTLSNVMARAGQKFKLECHVTGTPTPTVAWFHNSKPVKETPDCKLTFDGQIATLVMSEAFPKNAGIYTVVAKNSAGEAQCSANVSVKGRIPTETSDSEVTSDVDVEPVKPSIQLALKDTSVKEGKSARLDCVIVGQPEPEVIWYHDDTPVKESSDFKLLFHGDRCSLIIQEAFLEDSGIYRVVAMNSAGEASTACFLNVEPEPELTPPPVEAPPAVAPRFSELMTDTHVTEGQAVILKATVTGDPKPTVAWFRENVELLPDSDIQLHEDNEGHVTAEIAAATLDHTGQYEIVASNSAGTAKCVAYLSIEQRLPTPPTPVGPQEPPVFIRTICDASVPAGTGTKFEAEVTGIPVPMVSPSSIPEIIPDFSNVSVIHELNNDKSNSLQNRDLNGDIPSQIGNCITDLKCNNDVDNNSDCENTIEMKEDLCKNMEIIGKDDFNLLLSNLNNAIRYTPLEENNNEINEDIKYDRDADESFSQLSNFQNMKVLDLDTYSRFVMENVVVYGSLDETGPINCFDQFCRYDNIKIMDSGDYAGLVVEGYDSDKESLTGSENGSVQGFNCDTLSFEANASNTIRFLDTGLGQDIKPIKLADLWNIIKDTLPSPGEEPCDGLASSKCEDNTNRRSTGTSESEPESGYFSGNFSSTSDGADYSTSQRSSLAESPDDSTSKNVNIISTQTYQLSKAEKEIENGTEDHSIEKSSDKEKDKTQNLKSSRKSSHLKELSPLSENSEEYDSDHNSNNIEYNQIKKVSDFDVPAFKNSRPVYSQVYKESMWKCPDSDLDLIESAESSICCCDHPRCSSVLSAISEESGVSDCEEVSFPKQNIEMKHNEGSIGVNCKTFNLPGTSSSNEYFQTEVDENGNPILVQTSYPKFNQGTPIDDNLTNVTQHQNSLSTSINDESKERNEAERRARRAARLIKLKELTKVLRSPSKLSESKGARENENQSHDTTSNETCQPPHPGVFSFRPIIPRNSTQPLTMSSQFIQCELGNMSLVSGMDPSSSSNKAYLFLVNTVEKLSRLDFMRIIIDKLKALMNAGQTLVRAYLFPFSQANVFDFNNSDQNITETLPTDGVNDVTYEANILSTGKESVLKEAENDLKLQTPALIEAGCYFIILCYNEAPDL